MTGNQFTLEPLADYLAPQFGDIYEHESQWTPALKTAVKHYLIHEVPEDGYAAFLEELGYDVPAGPRESQADFIITTDQPWEISCVFHAAAVKAVPTLDQLIGHLKSWQTVDQNDDVGLWLETHASPEQRDELFAYVDHLEPSSTAHKYPEVSFYAPWPVAPPELLNAWHHVVDSAD